MESLEDDEYPLQKVFFNTDAVVANGKFPIAVLPACSDGYCGRGILLPELDGVRDKVLKQQIQFCRVSMQGRQRIRPDGSAALSDDFVQVSQYFFQQLIAIYLPGFLFPADPGIIQQVLDLYFHPVGGLGHIVQVLIRISVEPAPVLLLQ